MNALPALSIGNPLEMNNFEPFKQIRTFLFDVDGVFTNSQLLITEEGHLLRSMTVRDGYAVKQALKKGYRIAVITGGRSTGVIQRLNNLGIQDVFSGVQNKLEVYRQYLASYQMSGDEVLYLGDDLPDFEVMQKVRLACAPRDAAPEILQIADYISPCKGGEGCVRDVIEKVLKLNHDWPNFQKAVLPS